MSLEGRVALVTGGGRGIGRAIAEKLAAQGSRVVVAGRTRSEIEAVARATGGLAVPMDLCDRIDFARALSEVAKHAGRVDVLVNNAGIAESAPLERTTDAVWDKMLETNVTAAFRLCRTLVPAMVAAGWGRVVNVASNAGVTGYAYTAAYCASKHALVGLTRALAADLAGAGVTVNAVCPGWVDTQMLDRAVERIVAKTGRSQDDARATLAQMSPQHRLLEPREVAHVVAMLCDEDARGINGQTLVIDGGQILK